MFNILRSIKSIFVHIRSSIKFILILFVATALIAGIISVFYKVTYEVTLNGEFIGYTSNKSMMQKKINEYMEAKEESNVAFVDIEILPEYSLCLLKREAEVNDDEIFEQIIAPGKKYYEYYAIAQNGEEKYYVPTKEIAETVINELDEKDSNNIDELSYTQVYGTELKDFQEKDVIVGELYEEKVTTYYYSYTLASSSTKIDLSKYGIDFIKPVSSGYTITSRFGWRSSGEHTGLDVAADYGTTIVAAESGTVTLAGNYGNGYGNYIMISHGNGVETLYGHCSNLYVTEGQKVSKGEAIAAVGSTGNSTGDHLHLEIRVNGTILDPQNYLY